MGFLDCNGTVEYPYSMKTVFDAVMAAAHDVDGMWPVSADEMSGHVVFKTGMSLMSFGETVSLQLMSVTSRRTAVEIVSSPARGYMAYYGMAGNGWIWDGGKNRRNIENLISAISARLDGIEPEDDGSDDVASVVDELLKLRQLQDSGALSQAEFDSLKADILSGKRRQKAKRIASHASAQTERVPREVVYADESDDDPYFEEPRRMKAGWIVLIVIAAVALTVAGVYLVSLPVNR